MSRVTDDGRKVDGIDLYQLDPDERLEIARFCLGSAKVSKDISRRLRQRLRKLCESKLEQIAMLDNLEPRTGGQR